MGLRFDPVGGGQFKQAVAQIIEAESHPVKALEKRKEKEDVRLKLFNEFKTKFMALDKAVSDIVTFKKLRDLKADLGDGANLMSVTLDNERANTGQYFIEIDSIAKNGALITTGIENPQEKFGAGLVGVTGDDGSYFEFSIDEDSSTLIGIANVINQTPHSPVHAEVIQDASSPPEEWKMIIKSQSDKKNFSFEDVSFSFSGVDLTIDTLQEAENASLVVDNFPIELASNDVVDFLPGVNVHLKGARPDLPFLMTITEDYEKISTKMKNLVEQINAVLGFISKQNTVDERTDTSVTFTGDSSFQLIEYKLRSLVHGYFNIAAPGEDPETIALSELGIEFEKNGQLTFKEEKFVKVLESDFEKMARALSGPSSFGGQLKTIVNNAVRANDGMLTTKEKALKQRMKEFEHQIDDKNRLLEKRKIDLVNKFARLEASLGNLNSQQQSISATLGSAGGALPGLG